MGKKTERFGGLVSSMDLDQRYIYGCSKGTVMLWDRESMACVHTWDGLPRGSRISVDGDRIYCTTLYHFKVIDTQRWVEVYSAQFGSDISSDLGYPIHDRDHVYFPIRNGALAVIDKHDYANARLLKEHAGTIWGMAQDDRSLYTGSVDGTVRVWEKPDLPVVRVLTGHKGNVQRVHVAGPYLVSGATDLSVIIWDRETGQMVHRIRQAHRRAINGLASWNGLLLTSSMAERKVRIWEMGSWALKKELELSLAEGAGPRVDGDTVYLALRREPGVHACRASEIFT
ncbi:MAG: hypothetical protein ACOY94_11570 [Bacillota bacterium]